MQNQIKYIARFKVETLAPLAIGAGRGGLLNERLIAKDANGLPYIPGSSLAGIVRHELERDDLLRTEVNSLFGFQVPGEDEGQGSRIVFSPGLLIAHDDLTVIEGLQENLDRSKPYYQSFKRLPQRDHVRINHRGVAAKTGKFEEELVHKGTRFSFEIELEGSEADSEIWSKILAILNAPSFRIGAGTRKGFGQLEILSCVFTQYNLTEVEALKEYLGKSSSLNSSTANWQEYKPINQPSNWLHYELCLRAENFFLFGSGLPSQTADLIPKKERFFVWKAGAEPTLEEQYLIPATSLKGVLSHRIAFHYNKGRTSVEQLLERSSPQAFDVEKEAAELIRASLPDDIGNLNYAPESPEWKRLEKTISDLTVQDSPSWLEYIESVLQDDDAAFTNLPVGEDNEAVKALFGFAKNDETGARGKVILSDLYLEEEKSGTHHFNHVSIDRFTGGARDGALFTQEVTTYADTMKMDIFVEPEALMDQAVRDAFENTLDDLCAGQLQLGGNSAKGHGAFVGTWELKNNH
jgi:CRISPR/Cas system CSM-associated protein Csm3 (group 7 of RAMP superfamily)